jgi:hypothetical protein
LSNLVGVSDIGCLILKITLNHRPRETLSETWIHNLTKTKSLVLVNGQHQAGGKIIMPKINTETIDRQSVSTDLNTLKDKPEKGFQVQEENKKDVLNTRGLHLGSLITDYSDCQGLFENDFDDSSDTDDFFESEPVGLNTDENDPFSELDDDTDDPFKNEPSLFEPCNDSGSDEADTNDVGFKNIKTLSLPEPPLESFHPAIQEAVLNISRSKQCPVEVPVSAVIAAAAGLVGRSRRIRSKKGWSEPGNLFLGLVAPSSTGKSPGQSAVFKPIYRIEKLSQENYSNAMISYETDLDNWEKTKGPNNPKPQKPERKDLILDDWTIESVSESLLKNPKGVLLIRDELSGMLMDFDKYSGGKGSTKTKLMTAYDADKPWKITRVNADRNGYIPNPSISLYGGIQPAVICKMFSGQDQQSGFLGRFDFIQAVQKKPATFTTDEETDQTIKTIEKLCIGLDSLSLTPEGESKHIDVADDAKTLFREWHDNIANEGFYSADEDESSLLAKIRARGLRICLLLHCMDSVLDDADEMIPISRDTMSRALSLMDWLRIHTQATWRMLRLKAQAPTGQQIRVANAIINIEHQIKKGWLSTADITQEVNSGQQKRFHLSNINIGKICSDLGLENKATSSARGFLITSENITWLRNLSVNPTSHPSHPPQTPTDEVIEDDIFGD